MFDAQTQQLLDRYRFDPERFEAQRAWLRSAPFAPTMAHVHGDLAPLERDRFVIAEDRARGEEAIRRGEVAFLLLNGGMATRFGGVAKGAAKALGERSFLALRMGQAKQVADALGARVPCVLMNSFATDAATAHHLEKHARFGFAEDDVYRCVQGISVRLTETGDVFVEDSGRPSLYTPGHGDLAWTLEVNGIADKLKARGVKTLFVSNVDNVGCSLDPALLGAHLAAHTPMSVETVDPDPKDVGGAPLYVDGKLQLIEGFRLPKGFDGSSLTGFNINSFYFEWPALNASVQLAFYPVAKKVDGRTAIQFERIAGEISAHFPTTYLRVPRDAEHGRFLPVKSPEDLVVLQPILTARYG